MKTLINIEKKTWAEVKYFATMKEVPLNNAVNFLLQFALGKSKPFQQEEIKST